ncbi:hypothetical protein FLONG3_2320 [Fusarium longipes]|uniref:Uncharacterized protein n=1 Tax=Fusarium longipes TaxID=694270 RepID=A0A395T5J5_9HYPO|nr:hypothetical protein FLONG3_2320 [Fusarium longipes]
MSEPFLNKSGALALVIIIIFLLGFRWFGLILHHFGRMKYRSTRRGENPSNINLPDIAVILAVVDHQSENFIPTVESILKNLPGHLYIVTVGSEACRKVERQMTAIRQIYRHSKIHIGAVNKANKRRQIAHAIRAINDSTSRLTVITDQGVYWPSMFLMSACFPFDDMDIAAVTVPKRVHTGSSLGIWGHVKAHLFSFYYSVQAEDNRAVNNLDNSALFGGPTTLVRTNYLKEDKFKSEFENERWFFGRSGPVKGEEHFYLNRYLLGRDKRIFFEDSPEATISIEMNSIGKFIDEFLCTTRNNWRTCYFAALNCVSLLVRTRHVTYPAAAVMTWWPNVVSFVLLIDLLSIILAFNYSLLNNAALYAWLIVTIMVVIVQAITGLLVARRMHRSNGGKFNVLTTFICVILSITFQYALECFKIAALLTFWKTETEKPASQDMEMRGESELPWNWGYMIMRDDGEFWHTAYGMSWHDFIIEE